MNILYHKQAVKAIERLDATSKKRISNAILKLPEGDIKRLRGYINLYRLRIGDWRVLFAINENSIIIEDVLPRGGAYK